MVKFWSYEELRILKKLYGSIKVSELKRSFLLNKTEKAIIIKARMVRKSPKVRKGKLWA